MYSKDDKVLIWLDLFDNLTYKKKEQLLAMYESPSQMYDDFLANREVFSGILTNKLYDDMAYNHSDKIIDETIKQLERKSVIAITYLSSIYPDKLKNIDTPPFVLYCIGDVSLLNKKSFGIVGTRRITNYGRTITEMFAKGLTKANFCIVSGLSCGVDTVAHETALESKGKTIAVLAGGFDYIYPDINVNLAKVIAKNGLLISEIKPTERAKTYYFPIRNRIIAALSEGILITEADEKSGSMHTKNYALEYGKDIFAVPGNITSSVSAGPNRIISNGQAKAVCNLEDILDEYNVKYVPKQKTVVLTIEEQLIINALGDEELYFQEIVEKTKLDTKTLNTLLTTMVLNGLIKKLAGNMYSAK